MYEYVRTALCRDLVVHDDKLESKLSTAKLFDRPLFYSFRRDPAARYSIKLQLIQFTARHVEIKKKRKKEKNIGFDRELLQVFSERSSLLEQSRTPFVILLNFSSSRLSKFVGC